MNIEEYAISKGYHPMKDYEDGISYVVLWEDPYGTFHARLPQEIVEQFKNEIVPT